MNNILKPLLMTIVFYFISSPVLAENAKQLSLNSLDTHAIQTIVSPQDNAQHITTLYRDLDEDGVPDRQDHCLNSEPGFPVNALGCELDIDGDGIFDRNDHCPETPVGIKVNFLGCEGDKDKDRILDSQDKCPNTPLGIKVDSQGCKAEYDTDGDGVVNSIDLCPETPLGTTVNNQGCKAETFIITNIIFNTGSYAIRADQRSILNDVAARLKEKAENEIIVITGHTDNVGTEQRNKQLSWNRAQHVKNYFASEFNYIEERIFVLGLGESQPSSTNATSEGRQANRRITFEILEKDQLHQAAKQNIPENMKGYDRYGFR